jgi:hypothetical protein
MPKFGLKTIDSIKEAGVLDNVMYLDLCNEWPGSIMGSFFPERSPSFNMGILAHPKIDAMDENFHRDFPQGISRNFHQLIRSIMLMWKNILNAIFIFRLCRASYLDGERKQYEFYREIKERSRQQEGLLILMGCILEPGV